VSDETTKAETSFSDDDAKRNAGNELLIDTVTMGMSTGFATHCGILHALCSNWFQIFDGVPNYSVTKDSRGRLESFVIVRLYKPHLLFVIIRRISDSSYSSSIRTPCFGLSFVIVR